jgi:SAM-dependent methyltransferase
MARVSYGFDAPGVMRGLLAAGAVGIIAGTVLSSVLPNGWRLLAIAIAVVSVAPLLLGFVMFFYGVFGKLRMRDFMIGRIAWRGDERVLDIGTGRGLLLIAAAKRLKAGGQAVGIDIWRQEDLTGNSLDALASNVTAEGVDKRVALLTEDARVLSFAENAFDVVLSLYCIHNIEDKAEQRKACFEVARVLKPGGKALIAEYIPTHDYAGYFREAGLHVAFSKSFFGVAFGPMWMVEAVKAPSQNS